MSIMLGQPNSTYIAPNGTYVSDQYGIIKSVQVPDDQASLQQAGCSVLSPAPTNLIAKLIGANFNSTADQRIPLIDTTTTKFRVTDFVVLNASVSLSAAAGGIYTGLAKTGTTLVAAGQTYATLTVSTKGMSLTLNAPNEVLPAGQAMYLSLTTPQGLAATADIYAFGQAFN